MLRNTMSQVVSGFVALLTNTLTAFNLADHDRSHLRPEDDMVKRLLYRFYERRLLDEVLHGRLPRHLGLIQDGHRRYAREAGVSNVKGYRLGAAKAEEVLTWCAQLKIPMVTLWIRLPSTRPSQAPSDG